MSSSDSSKSGKPGGSESRTELRQDAKEIRNAVKSKKGLLAEVGMDAKSRRKPAPSLDGPRENSETRLIRVPHAGGIEADAEGADNSTAEEEGAFAGWLVIMDGPGTGRDMRLGYGITTLGRGESCDIVLDFGDEKISRSPNCRVVVDPNSQACFVQQDGGRNLVYLNDNPVLSPSTVTSGDRITIGETVLMLVRISPDFIDWSSNDSRN